MEKRYRQNYVMGRIIRKIQKNGLLAIVEWVMGYTYHHAELRYYIKNYISVQDLFLNLQRWRTLSAKIRG